VPRIFVHCPYYWPQFPDRLNLLLVHTHPFGFPLLACNGVNVIHSLLPCNIFFCYFLILSNGPLVGLQSRKMYQENEMTKKQPDYGLALRAYMGIHGITCVDLAKRIGKSPSMISYLRGKKTWPDANMDEICEALGVSKQKLEMLHYSIPEWAKK